jgi:hypothetical protein
MKLDRYCNSSASDRFHGEASSPAVVMRCEYCGGPICDGEEYYSFNDLNICDACAWAFAFAHFEQEANRRTASEQ